MGPASLHQINSLDEMIEAVLDARVGIRLPDADCVVRIGIAEAVRLWVEAEHDNMEVALSDGAIEFGVDDRWIRKQLRRRSGRCDPMLHKGAKVVPAEVLASPCYLCGRKLDGQQAVNRDHWYPRSLGGPDEPWNLRWVHVMCNVRKGDSVLPEAEAAYRAWMGQ